MPNPGFPAVNGGGSGGVEATTKLPSSHATSAPPTPTPTCSGVVVDRQEGLGFKRNAVSDCDSDLASTTSMQQDSPRGGDLDMHVM